MIPLHNTRPSSNSKQKRKQSIHDFEEEDKYQKKRQKVLFNRILLIIPLIVVYVWSLLASDNLSSDTNSPSLKEIHSDGIIKDNFPKVSKDTQKLSLVKSSFKHAYTSYKSLAFPKDTLHPLSKTSSDWFGLSLTLIDSLSTSIIMNYTTPVQDATGYVSNYLSFIKDGKSNIFELSIRVLGGMLSAYYLSGEEVYLRRSIELADLLIPCFSTVPCTSFNFKTRECVSDVISLAEFTSIQLEWKYLSFVSGDIKYWEVVERAMGILIERHKEKESHGDKGEFSPLVPIYYDPNSRKFSGDIRLGSRGDSYYEYLIKQYIQSGEVIYKEMFESAVDSIINELVGYSYPGNLLFVAELQNGKFTPKMDHLVCFLPGSVLLYVSDGKELSEKEIKDLRASNVGSSGSKGSSDGDLNDGGFSKRKKKYFEFAERLLYTCYRMYEDMSTGLSPEIVYFNEKPKDSQNKEFHDSNDHNPQNQNEKNNEKDIIVHPQDAHNLLRPETIESLFYFYKITGNETYRDWAFKIYLAFEACTRVENGYSSIKNVNPERKSFNGKDGGNGEGEKDDKEVEVEYLDRMESFFLSETLKYFYLIFEDSEFIHLHNEKSNSKDKGKKGDKLTGVVFNTEAHVLPILRDEVNTLGETFGEFRERLIKSGLGYFGDVGGDKGNGEKNGERNSERKESVRGVRH